MGFYGILLEFLQGHFADIHSNNFRCSAVNSHLYGHVVGIPAVNILHTLNSVGTNQGKGSRTGQNIIGNLALGHLINKKPYFFYVG